MPLLTLTPSLCPHCSDPPSCGDVLNRCSLIDICNGCSDLYCLENMLNLLLDDTDQQEAFVLA